MNRKGFTLIELLVVLVIIGLLMVFLAPGVFDALDSSKEESYNTLVKNIVTASKMYYQECEYGDLSNVDKYGDYACKIDANKIDTTLRALAETGFLKVSDVESGEVINPINQDDMGDCKITISKISETVKDTNGIENTKISYSVTPKGSLSGCPGSY